MSSPYGPCLHGAATCNTDSIQAQAILSDIQENVPATRVLEHWQHQPKMSRLAEMTEYLFSAPVYFPGLLPESFRRLFNSTIFDMYAPSRQEHNYYRCLTGSRKIDDRECL